MKNESVAERALQNYSEKNPWPVYDPWHHHTVEEIDRFLQTWSDKYLTSSDVILVAGCGTREYHFAARRVIYMDIMERYAMQFSDHIVGSVESIPLEDQSVDAIICVGTVLNYTDAAKTISEFSRILKPGGHLCLEYERSDSAEFCFTPDYGKDVFESEQTYNDQSHLLYLYSEKYIRNKLKDCHFTVLDTRRFHLLSALFLRLGMRIGKAAAFINLDFLFRPMSKYMACNGIMSIEKSDV